MTKIIGLYSITVLILGLNPIICVFWTRNSFFQLENPNKNNANSNIENIVPWKPEPKKYSTSNVILWRESSLVISDLIPPEIFSQSDPVLYLIEETAKLPRSKISTLKVDLKYVQNPEIQLPEQYVPYVKVLYDLVNCHSHLLGTTRAIRRIRSSLIPNPSLADFDFGSTEISELFSSDIFLDENAPFKLLIKLIDIPSDKVASLSTQLESIILNGQLPQQYTDYAKEMMTFLKRNLPLNNLIQSVIQLRHISAIKLPIFGQLPSKDQLRNKYNKSPTKVSKITVLPSESKDTTTVTKNQYIDLISGDIRKLQANIQKRALGLDPEFEN